MRKWFNENEKSISVEDVENEFENMTLEKFKACKTAYLGANRKKYLMLTATYAFCQTLKNDTSARDKFLDEPYFECFTHELKPDRILSYGIYYLIDAAPKSSEYRRARAYINAFQPFFDNDFPALSLWKLLCKKGLNRLIEDSQIDDDVPPESGRAKTTAGMKITDDSDARIDDGSHHGPSFDNDDDETDDMQTDEIEKISAIKKALAHRKAKEIEKLKKTSEKLGYILVEHVDPDVIKTISKLPPNEEFYMRVIKRSSDDWWELEVASLDMVQ